MDRVTDSLLLSIMQPGQLLCNRYRIKQHLAGGGFGQTYLAVDTFLPSQPQVVVKLLNPMSTDPRTLEIAERLFYTEAYTLEKLGKGTDRIPSLYAYFELEGKFYLVQEWIEGKTLTDELNAQKLSESATIDILKEILTALSQVHNQDIIHRDLKPDNIIRRQSDRKLVLIDFGAVKQVRAASTTTSNPAISHTIGIGTEGYMPSEQGMGYPKPASDIYAVGAIGIQCLTGSAPHLLFNNDNLSIEWQHLCQVDRDLMKVLTRMVEPDYRQRYANAVAALQAIESLTVSPDRPGKPSSPTIPIPPSSSLTQPIELTSIFSADRQKFYGGVALTFSIGFMYAIRLLAVNFSSVPPNEPVVTSASSVTSPELNKTAIAPTPTENSSDKTQIDATSVKPSTVSSSEKPSNVYQTQYVAIRELLNMADDAVKIGSRDKAKIYIKAAKKLSDRVIVVRVKNRKTRLLKEDISIAKSISSMQTAALQAESNEELSKVSQGLTTTLEKINNLIAKD